MARKVSTLVLIVTLAAALLVATAVLGAPPSYSLLPTSYSPPIVSYQGRLTDAAGRPITGSITLTVRLYDQADFGTLMWSETYTDVQLFDGVFVLALGSISPVQAELVAGPRWIEVAVNSNEPLTPRQPLSAAPYALTAANAAWATTATLALSTTQAAWAGLTGVPADLADGDDIGAPAIHTHSGGDITSAVPTATAALTAALAMSTTHAPWSGLTGVPAGFADGVDNTAIVVSQTAVYAGEGLAQTSTSQALTLSVHFAGTGQAASAARSDHQHAGSYAPLAHTHAGSDITSAVPMATNALTATSALSAATALSATLALSATHAPWAGLTGIPADLADGDDIGAPAVHTHDASDITTGLMAEARISQALARDAEIPALAAVAGYITRTAANAAYAPTIHQHAGGDIISAVPTATVALAAAVASSATVALSATHAAWAGLTGVPAGFADGVDNTAIVVSQTSIHAGEGLIQTSTSQALTLSVHFAGTGQAASAARSDHQHTGSYAPVVHTHAGGDISSAVPTATLALSATHIAWPGLTGIPADLADGDDIGAPVVHTHAGSDIISAVPTATVALTATAALSAAVALSATQAISAAQSPWSGLTGIPADLADGDDIGAPVIHTHAGGDITTGTIAEARVSSALARDAEIPDLAAAAGYITRTAANAAYAPSAHQHTGGDITSAVATATLALSTTQSAWAGLTGVPPDLADGDDIITYTAGFGLAVTNSQFSVVTAAVQARIAAACAPGSLIAAIQPDGAPICRPDAPFNRLTAPAANTLSTLDSAGDVGQYASVTIGADGLPIIAYHDEDNGALKVAHCADLACTTADLTTLDTACGSAWWTSIAIGADGLPIISYYSDNDGALKVAHCADPACTGATFSLPDDPLTDTVGYYSSIAIGSDGLPIISYHDATHTSLKVAHCADPACSAAVPGAIISVTLDDSGDVGWWTSIAVGADGLPVIAYHDASTGAQGLKVAHCGTVTCSAAAPGAVVSVTLDAGANLGWYASLAVGADGLPIVSYYDFTHTALKVAHCQDVVCSGATLASLDDDGDVGRFSALTIGADRLPVIAYHDFTHKTLRVAHCHDLACSAASHVVVDGDPLPPPLSTALWGGIEGGANIGQYSALTIGVDGLPLLAYYDGAGVSLRAAHCANPLCVPYFRRR